MRARIRRFVVRAIESRAQLPADVNIDQINYVDSGYVDSMGMIKFVLEIETEFGIEILAADMELIDFKTIGGLASIIEAKLKEVGKAND